MSYLTKIFNVKLKPGFNLKDATDLIKNASVVNMTATDAVKAYKELLEHGGVNLFFLKNNLVV